VSKYSPHHQKKCTLCKEYKLVGEYYKRGPYIRSWCKTCCRVESRRQYAGIDRDGCFSDKEGRLNTLKLNLADYWEGEYQ